MIKMSFLIVGILSVPMTYPAWEVDGVMVSGYPLPDYARNHGNNRQHDFHFVAA